MGSASLYWSIDIIESSTFTLRRMKNPPRGLTSAGGCDTLFIASGGQNT